MFSKLCRSGGNAADNMLDYQPRDHKFGPASFKFHMQPSSKGSEKVYIFQPGHMTEIAAMPIYGKNLKKYSSQEALDLLP